MKEYLFFQKIVHKKVELELDFLQSATLILKVNSLAPQLILKFFNPGNIFLEEIGIGIKNGLEVELEDTVFGLKRESLSFVVTGMHPDFDNDVLVLECIEENVFSLEGRDCRIFHKRSIPEILQILTPELQISCGKFPNANTYHLPNKRRFALIARMAREYGALFFIRGGELIFKSWDELSNQPDQGVYEYRNPEAEMQIFSPRSIDREYGKENEKRHYIGWHIEKGMISASSDKNYQPLMVNPNVVSKLNNLSISTSPIVSFQSPGNGSLALGSPLKLLWHSGAPERPLDESYPKRVVVGQLIHHESRNSQGIAFTTKVYGIV